jgi:hypothetical protein
MLCSVCRLQGDFACQYCEGRARYCSKQCYKIGCEAEPPSCVSYTIEPVPGPSHKAFCNKGHGIDFYAKTTKAAVLQTLPPEKLLERCWREVQLDMKPEPLDAMPNWREADAQTRLQGMPNQLLRFVALRSPRTALNGSADTTEWKA